MAKCIGQIGPLEPLNVRTSMVPKGRLLSILTLLLLRVYLWILSLVKFIGQIQDLNFPGGAIERANLDGSGRETLIDQFVGAEDIVLDVSSDKMYWGKSNIEGQSGSIQRANLDGSNIETLVDLGLNYPSGIAIDRQLGKLYWTAGVLERSNLNGSAREELPVTTPSLRGIALLSGVPPSI